MSYKFRKTGKREEIFEAAIDQVGRLISQKSRSQAIDHSVKMGTKYLDRMREAKKDYKKLEKEIEELETRKQELKSRWETEEIGFEDI